MISPIVKPEDERAPREDNLPNVFMDVCRENMTKAMFARYVEEAQRRIKVGNQLPAPLD